MLVRQRSPVLLVCCCLTAYFAFHALHGKHGLEARAGLHLRATKLAVQLRELEAVRARLEREVALLSDAGPDPAYVEELARDMLAYARPDERIILDPEHRLAALP